MSTHDALVDIRGVDKVELLRALWMSKTPAAYLVLNGMEIPEFDNSKADIAVKAHIDYFCGRCIKADISGDFVDAHMYDKSGEATKFVEIVNLVRIGITTFRPVKPMIVRCPDGSGIFCKYDEPLILGNPGSVPCGNCMYTLQHHKYTQ